MTKADKAIKEVLERNIERKAEVAHEQFWKELESLFNRYGIRSNARFDGLRGAYAEKEDNGDQWRKRLMLVFIKKETEKMVSEMYRLQDYFRETM